VERVTEHPTPTDFGKEPKREKVTIKEREQ
jgi:hypothetical protein